jgi:hypothetical protein
LILVWFVFINLRFIISLHLHNFVFLFNLKV